MQLRHEFTVPATIEETWAAFNDIESVAVCFPGATVSSVDGDTFAGSCKVKLGPIALVYNGTGTFVDKDEARGRMVIDAKGKDKRGNGTAGAHVTATMTGSGASTRVEVLTDLNITGKPAQFGRGVMQDVSDKLLGQFTACLEDKVGRSSAASLADSAGAPASSGSPSMPAGGDDVPPSGPDRTPDGGRDLDSRAPQKPGNDQALDLGATVLPVLARAYWRQALGAALAILVLARALRRRG